MPFINEFISEADMIKYNLEKINRTYKNPPPAGIPTYPTPITQWTVDKERDIYLRKVTTNQGRPDMGFENDGWEGWTLYYKGELIWFVKKTIKSIRLVNDSQHSYYEIKYLTIPNNLKIDYDIIYELIKDSFTKYAGGGICSTATEFTATFTFTE
jgi:CRISPR/Cas system-associated exonuclease Cas4 (RecB family)